MLKLSDSELRNLRGRDISIIYQEPALALNPVMRVGEQIAEVLRAHRALSSRERRAQAHEVLDQVKLGAERYYSSYPHELSGGERHRVVLAQALVCRPALVIADEPTAGLDTGVKNEILGLIESLQRETGAAFLVISHDRSVTGRLTDAIIDLPCADGPSRVSAGARASSISPDRSFAPVPTAPLISVRNLSKRYRPRGLFGRKYATRQALDRVELSIARGSLTALLGPSGSGKSTLARCLTLLEEPDEGEIHLEGKDLLRLPARALRSFRARLQYVSQDPAAALNPRLTAAETIAEPLVIQNLGTKHDRMRRVESLIEQTGLDPATAHRSCHQFSGGQKQRLVVARALDLAWAPVRATGHHRDSRPVGTRC